MLDGRLNRYLRSCSSPGDDASEIAQGVVHLYCTAQRQASKGEPTATAFQPAGHDVGLADSADFLRKVGYSRSSGSSMRSLPFSTGVCSLVRSLRMKAGISPCIFLTLRGSGCSLFSAAALLFPNYLLSQESQDTLMGELKMRPVRTDVPIPESLAQLMIPSEEFERYRLPWPHPGYKSEYKARWVQEVSLR